MHISLAGDANSDDQMDPDAQSDLAMEHHSTRWHEMLTTWGSDHKISLSQVGSLWQGLSWMVRKQAHNPARWQCDNVNSSCIGQVEEPKSYLALVPAAPCLPARML
jgi:hypothetical protein